MLAVRVGEASSEEDRNPSGVAVQVVKAGVLRADDHKINILRPVVASRLQSCGSNCEIYRNFPLPVMGTKKRRDPDTWFGHRELSGLLIEPANSVGSDLSCHIRLATCASHGRHESRCNGDLHRLKTRSAKPVQESQEIKAGWLVGFLERVLNRQTINDN